MCSILWPWSNAVLDLFIVAEVPAERLSLLRALLKLVLHMMQTSGTADRLRNLIDSTLPTSVLQVLAYSKTFGPGVFSLATNIMSTFIHNEPTCLSILQELKLPQTFLFSIKQHIPFSPEVVTAIPTAFGAVCLNQAGLDMYNTVAPMDKFLELFVVEANLRPLLDNDVPQVIGGSIDELMRHQTSLKDSILTSVVSLVKKVRDICQALPASAKEDSALHVKSAVEDEPASTEAKGDDKEKKDHLVSNYIDSVARILDGLFTNIGHAKDFVRLGGVEELLKYYTFPALPYDFAALNSSYSLSHILRLLMEVEPKPVITSLIKSLASALADVNSLCATAEGSLVSGALDLDGSDPLKVEQNNNLFRSVIRANGYVGLLTDFFYTPVLSHSKSISAVLQLFSGDEKLIELLCQLQRFCFLELFLLKEQVPKQWWSKIKKPTDSSSTGGTAGAATAGAQQSTSTGTASATAEPAGSGSAQGGNDGTAGPSTDSAAQDAAAPITFTATELQNSAAQRVTGVLVSNFQQITDIVDSLASTVSKEGLEPVSEQQQSSAAENDIRHKNFRVWKFLLNLIPTSFTSLFQGVLKLLLSRRVSDPLQRKSISKIVADLAAAFAEGLRSSKLAGCSKATKYSFIAALLGQFNSLLHEGLRSRLAGTMCQS